MKAHQSLAGIEGPAAGALLQAAQNLTNFAHRSARRYGDELLALHCSADLLTLKLFPNFKEVTESFGAYNAVRAHLHKFSFGDPDITLLAVGDGHSPRTGATFAFRSAWRCISVDPEMREHVWPVERLNTHRARIEDVTIPGKRVVIVAVHSHATLQASIDACAEAEEIAVVALPCCTPLELTEPPDHEAPDYAIASPERLVRVWRSVAHLRSKR